jgi:hypothetical protein
VDRKLLPMALITVVALIPAWTYAWGPDGHKIVATIAAGHLTPQAQVGVKQLQGDQSRADVSTWADDIKSDHRYFGMRLLLTPVT